jgi:restriction system protein
MARRNNSIPDALASLPWQFNVALAICVFFSFKYVLPVIPVTNPLLTGIAHLLQTMAPVLALIILMVAGVSAFNAWRKARLLEGQKNIESIRSVSWRAFEDLVGEAYRRRGYHVAETGGDGADGGVDLILKKDGETLFVQCKNWKTFKVGVKVVRELYGVVVGRGATGGIVITSGRFTQDAREFARGKRLELIDGGRLLRMIDEVKKPPSNSTVGEPKEDNLCPRCGSKMVLRVARKGHHPGEKFWGCTAFPKCREIKPYPSLRST